MPDKVRVLCVEDDADQRVILGKMFEMENEIRLLVCFAEDLASAIRQMNAVRFDAVLLDWFLPDAEGVESIKGIRAVDPDVPLVILTALDDMDANRLAIEASADGYITKPAMPRNIIHSLYSVIVKKQKPDPRVLNILAEIVKSIGKTTENLESAVKR